MANRMGFITSFHLFPVNIDNLLAAVPITPRPEQGRPTLLVLSKQVIIEIFEDISKKCLGCKDSFFFFFGMC